MPQRPLTAEGAQSTLQFTRLPVETPLSPTALLKPGSRVGSVAARNNGSAVAPPVVEIEESDAAVDALPDSYHIPEFVQNLAPEPSLERFIREFKYEPPTESEFTMGGTPIPDGGHFRPVPPPSWNGGAPQAPPPVDRKVFLGNEPAPVASEPVRSGIGVIEPAEEATDRPRFLDLGESSAERPRSGTSTVVGPSFLGLGDAPAIGANYMDDSASSGSRWRLWLALIVIGVLGVLGVLEWRSRTHGTTGPIQIVKLQIRKLKLGAASNNGTSDAAATSSSDNGVKPEIQVEPQAKPADTTAATAGANGSPSNTSQSPSTPGQTTTPIDAGAAQSASAPIGNRPASGGTSTTPAQQQTPTPPNVAPEQRAATPNPTTDKDSAAGAARTVAKSNPRESRDDEEVVTTKVSAGQEEMTKADQASDSAATAAWLWKAVAKGNPEAPVRLADMYVRGDGVPKSCDQALVLLKTAADKRNGRARNRLASMYATGVCVPRDRVQAYRWMSLALVADPSSEWAQQNRDMLWRQMTPEERAAAAKYR
jgi:hypothetical protein